MDKTIRNKDAVTQRILETTQETQRLKQELQSLIAAGISGNQNYNLPTSRTNIPLESTNKVQIIKSYDPKHSQHSKKPLEGLEKPTDPLGSQNEVEASSPKKPKGYNVHQAREYIKKQRDKRKEELKSKKSESQINAEMRKEKLHELQQKASELVKKNVEAKRQRSKSRDRTGSYVPPVNGSLIVGFNCAEKTKKHLEQPVVSQIRLQKPLKDPNLLYPPVDLGGKSCEAARDSKSSHISIGIAQNKHSKSLQNLFHPPEPHYKKEVSIPSNISVRASNIAPVVIDQQDKLKCTPSESKRQRSKSRDHTSTYMAPVNESVTVNFNCSEKPNKYLEPPNVSQNRPQKLRDPDSKSLNITGGNEHSKSLQNLSRPPEPHYNRNVSVQSNVAHRASNVASVVKDQQNELKCAPSKSTSHRSTESSTKNKSPHKGTNTSLSRDTMRLTDDCYVLVNDRVQSNYSESLSQKPDGNRHLSNECLSKKRIEVHSNITLKHADQFPCEAEYQKPKVVTPEWLKDTGEQGDPYNFINTVKRQLKYVVSEKKPVCVDVGVQGNMESDLSENKTSKISKKSDLKSFMSHKCLNLDPFTIQHIELSRKQGNFECRDGPTITNHTVSSDYDSDTSKNIPSISSESGTSLKRNAEFVKQSYVLSDLKPLENAPPNLDTKQIEEIKLRKHGKLSGSDIYTEITSNKASLSLKEPPLQEDVERIKKQLFNTESDCYSTDFIPTDLSKSRNSLISFNCAKVSPNRVPDIYKSRSDNLLSPSANSNTNFTLETEAISKISSTSHPLGNIEQGSQRKSSSLNSVSEEGSQNSQKRKTGSAKFYSLNSELHPSGTDPEVNLDVAHTDNSDLSSSQVRTDTSEKNGWKSDGFTEVLKPKKIFSDSDVSQWVETNDFSENTKPVTGVKGPEKSTGQLYKSKSEQIVPNTSNAGVFSKSDSNIYEDKENMKKMFLKEPKLSLNVRGRNRRGADESSRQALMKNISIRSGDRTNGSMDNTNEIHLKFEAEIHLLNDFNQSLKHFSEIEKAFESLRTKNESEILTKKVLHNRDTQTSIITRTSSKTVSKESDTSNSQISTINYKRGSGSEAGIDLEIHTDREDNTEQSRSVINSEIQVTAQDNDLKGSKGSERKSENLLELMQESDLTTVLNSVNLEETELDNITEKSTSIIQLSQLDNMSPRRDGDMNENLAIRNFAGMSLRMFDQLIKDEDARIENWKKIVKIREHALLDRTRGELVYLEIQKKQLIETGKMPEASLIKKKQRGIILKHQQEKHEMQRLKQMQKEASAKRKTLLKTEKNLIKNQLLSDNMLSKLRTSSHRERSERRLSGPLKVIQATESVHSETSLSKGVGGNDQQIKNITSRRTCSMVLSATSDNLISDVDPLELSLDRGKNINVGAISSMKKRLLMREHALAKRRKTVEELLQWHRKLLEEEKAIEDLESKVEKIISKIPSESNEQPTKDTQDLSKSILEKTSEDLNTPSMSQVVLERLLPSTETLSLKAKSISLETNENIPQEENVSEDSNKFVSSANYSTDFDVDSVPEVLPQNSEDQSNVSSISQLIENFSKIEENILNLSLVQRRHSLGSEEAASVKSEGAKTVSSSVAEDVVEDEEKSKASSHSNHITSEVEVKVGDESPSEIIQSEKQHDKVGDIDSSVILIEEPSVSFVADSKENDPIRSVDNEEIKEESAKKENTEEISENLWTVQNESENAPKTSLALIFEELSEGPVSEELKSASVEEVGEESVPDDSNKISLGDIANKTISGLITSMVSKISDDKPAEATKVSEEISVETNREEENPRTSSPEEQTTGEIQEDLQQIITENEPNNLSKDSEDEASVKTLEELQKTSQDVDIVAEVSSENSTHIQEASKPSTSHDKSAENSGILSTKEENIPSASHKSSCDEDDKISDQVLSEEPLISTSKGDSTSKQNEEIEEYEASNVDIPSSSHQTEEQATTSQILSLSKDDVSNILEQEPQNHSSTSTPGIQNEVEQSSSGVEEERQSFENKTDEEKVASLSIRATGNQSGSLSITRPSSLAIPEDSVSPSTSKIASKLSEDIQALAISEKRSKASDVVTSSEQTSITEKQTDESDKKDVAVRKLSKGSGSSRIDSVEEKLSESSLVQDNSVPIEERSKVSSSASKEVSKEILSTSNASPVQEKSLPLEEKSMDKEDKSLKLEESQSEASSVQDIIVSAAKSLVSDDRTTISTTKSPSSTQESVFSDKPSKSSTSKEKSSEKLDISSQKNSVTPEKLPSLDVKRRVQEILNEASPVSRGDKSPRMQDLCIMTYDLISPTQSPESGSPLEDKTKSFSLGSEAEELLKKQLAIEQEIKLLTEQQQKDQAPQFYIREIPNKPPPPYTPPFKAKAPKTPSIIPSSKEEIEQITEYSAKIIHKGYLSNNLDNISISDNTLNLIAKNIDKGCYKYVFDLCKEVAIDHYSQFTIEAGPSWLQLEKKLVLAPAKPLDVKGLKKLMYRKLLELFGFEKQQKTKENTIMKWSRKKRDHVDEVLVQEMQAEENSWTNFDKDELLVKDRITNEIMEMLLKETAQVLKKTVQKKNSFSH